MSNKGEKKPFYAVTKDFSGRNLRLDIQLSTGEHYGFAYAYLITVHFDGVSKITLSFPTVTVTIEGQNLADKLYQCLMLQVVEWVREASVSEFEEVDPKEFFITKIEVQKL